MSVPDISELLPPSLNLPPHLSAHKYFFVCTLTVAAWDTLVLSPRTWRLFKTKEWPTLKIIFHFMRLFMPIEFTIVAIAFFDTKFTSSMCNHFYLFEPICTAILMACNSAVHVIRVSAIYDNAKPVQITLSALFAAQVIITAVVCGFFRPMPLIFPGPPAFSGQGCIAGPKFADREWTGIYWAIPTVLYTVSFILALMRSQQSMSQTKQISLWKLMLRDGLNLYGAIFLVNLVNVLFWFIAKPTDDTDTIKTIVTSMAAVLTTTMTLRIVLAIRGPLAYGGTFHGSSSSQGTHTHSASISRTTNPVQVLSGQRSQNGVIAIHNSSVGRNGEVKEERWADVDDDRVSSNSVPYKEGALAIGDDASGRGPLSGVKVTIDRHVDDGAYSR